MKEIFVIDDGLPQKISYYHLLLLMISLPFDMFYSHIIIISFAIHVLIYLKKGDLKNLLSADLLVLQGIFWLSLICISYSSYKTLGWTEVSRRLIIFILPILLSLVILDLKRYLPRLMLAFSLTCVITITYLYVTALQVIRYYHYPIRSLAGPLFTKHNFSDPIEMHATFFAMQVGLALVYLITAAIKQRRFWVKIVFSLCCLILAAGLLQLGAKSALAAVALSVCVTIPLMAFHGRKRYLIAVGALLISGVCIFALLKLPAFKELYVKEFKQDMSPAADAELLDPRLARWDVAIDIIKKRPVLGYGTGAEIPVLKDGFYCAKLYNSFLKGLNAHDQYLSFLLKSGVAGLLVYLCILGYGFKTSIAGKDVAWCTFMVIVATVSVSENILDADKGIIFFAVFYSLFVFGRRTDVLKKARVI